MTLSAFAIPAIAGAVGLGLGVFFRFMMKSQRERRAWGTKPALTSQNRREIRRAVKKGLPVADPALAAPAVRLAEEYRAAEARMPQVFRDPPTWIQRTGLIFFFVLGTASLLIGIFDHDTASIVYGVVLYPFAVLYLPITQRWARGLRDRQRTRWQTAITANSTP